ncbi:TIR domain-containing protein [uncultured Kordia sp.]|uniref:TIR domain-containing protein n=1 Tax=uncultured Kordia sp. TaxID=507699 RepID=UPI002626470F|nr:TIR domain-containing protein [uncultured Kordia sp.]
MKHKIFISYHHENDFNYRKKYEKLFSEKFDILDSLSVKPGEIKDVSTEEFRRQIREKHLKESTVTVVLIGEDTWRRHHVDYEIYNSLKQTQSNLRSGVLGIILPSYTTYSQNLYDEKTIPKRLAQNISNGYLDIKFWHGNPEINQQWILKAFQKRKKITPNNSMPLMKRNWKGDKWQ